eukprot:1139858-Pelagomonas_calceolata.AAC.2
MNGTCLSKQVRQAAALVCSERAAEARHFLLLNEGNEGHEEAPVRGRPSLIPTGKLLAKIKAHEGTHTCTVPLPCSFLCSTPQDPKTA